MSSRREAEGIAVVLVGAEGVAELGEQPWLREATTEERRAFNQMLQEEKGLDNPAEAYIDHNGRPYWLMVVTSEAPEHIFQRALEMVRVVRLED